MASCSWEPHIVRSKSRESPLPRAGTFIFVAVSWFSSQIFATFTMPRGVLISKEMRQQIYYSFSVLGHGIEEARAHCTIFAYKHSPTDVWSFSNWSFKKRHLEKCICPGHIWNRVESESLILSEATQIIRDLARGGKLYFWRTWRFNSMNFTSTIYTNIRGIVPPNLLFIEYWGELPSLARR